MTRGLWIAIVVLVVFFMQGANFASSQAVPGTLAELCQPDWMDATLVEVDRADDNLPAEAMTVAEVAQFFTDEGHVVDRLKGVIYAKVAVYFGAGEPEIYIVYHNRGVKQPWTVACGTSAPGVVLQYKALPGVVP